MQKLRLDLTFAGFGPKSSAPPAVPDPVPDPRRQADASRMTALQRLGKRNRGIADSVRNEGGKSGLDTSVTATALKQLTGA